MIAVVTGSSGFIGSHLVQHLLARGATVRALVRPQSAQVSRDPRVEYHEVDFLNACAVGNSPVWNDATHVFHLAGITTAVSLEQFRRANVQPVANILAALSARPGPPRFIAVSTQAAAGPARGRDNAVSEEDAPAPVEAYGRSKREAERLVEACADKLPVTIVRPPAVYGPGDKDFLQAFRQALSAVAFHASAPDHWFDLLHVDDVVRALLLAAEDPAAVGRTYFLSHDQPTRWRDFYELVASCAVNIDSAVARAWVLHVPLPAVLLKGAAKIGDIVGLVTKRTPLLNSNKLALSQPAFWLCSSERIRRELKWRPQVTPQIGVRETYLWYVDAGWLSRRHPVTRTL